MSIATWCVFIAFFMPYIWIVFAKKGGYDNHNPRTGLNNLTGMRARAYAAHQNSFEAFAPFAVGVLLAQQAQVAQPLINQLAIAFTVARLLYGVCYLTDKASLRSLVWAAGFFSTAALLVLAAMQ